MPMRAHACVIRGGGGRKTIDVAYIEHWYRMTIDYKDARHSFQCLKLNIYGLCADDTGGTEEGEEHADK